MENERSVASSGGIGICGLLGVTFIVLRICGIIDWSWWWVTAPLWMPTALVIVIIIVLFVVYGIRTLRDEE